MTIGIVILAHEHLHRTRSLAKAIASPKVKVMIHVDANTPDAAYEDLRAGLSQNAHIDFSERVACEWGCFSLVTAGMKAARSLFERWPNVSHVSQISGSCLPTRPIKELTAFLERNEGRNFVESFPAHAENWVIDGLSAERFSLYFPFSFKHQRTLFEASVAIQRRLGVSRKPPQDLVPHLGSQWWCLSRQTLSAILNDPDLPEIDRYFSKCWIPDEGYIPTLVRKHGEDVMSRSLTLSRFDDQGKPHLFYDDHGDLLEQTDHFFARKVWHGADDLYRRFLKKKRPDTERSIASDFGLDILFEEAKTKRCEGRVGRLTVGRFPAAAHNMQPATAGPYGAFVGFGHIFYGFEDWLGKTTGTLAHGRLFKKNAVNFANHKKEMPGAIPACPLIRDHNPEQFLCNLLWNSRDQHQSVMIELSDTLRMCEFLINDPNAQLHVLEGSWVLELFARNLKDTQLLKRQANRLQQAEAAFIGEVRKSGRNQLKFIRFSDFVIDPDSVLGDIQTTLSPTVDVRPEARLQYRDFSNLREFFTQLHELGIETDRFGDLPEHLPGELPVPDIQEAREAG